MDKSKHTRTTFTKKENVDKHVNCPLLKHLSPLNDGIHEVEKQKKTIVHNLPLQIGLAVYYYAKLRMLNFWVFINEMLDNDLYQLMEMDTDSLYIAFARDTIDECVKPSMLARWVSEKYDWFVSDDKENMRAFEGHQISHNQWDQRTPGLFKIEYDGTGMACLNSKVYTCWGAVNKKGELYTKTSCKSVQQRRNKVLKDDFLNILIRNPSKPYIATNAGFRTDEHGTIYTYTQSKVGMSNFYAKREVLADGVSTTHLKI